MLLRAASNRLRVEGVYPLSLNDFTFDISSVDVDPKARETVENVLMQAARFSSGIWSMHYQNLAERIRTFELPKSEAAMTSVPLDYEPDPSKAFNSISGDHALAAVRSLNEQSDAWREGLFKGRLWRSSTQHLLNSVYLPRLELVVSQADRMTKGAVDTYVQALRDNLDVVTVFGMKDTWGRPNKNFLKMAGAISLIYGIELFNRSLDRLYVEVFRGSLTHAAEALMGDDVVEPRLKEWAFAHRWKGFYAPTFHGELALRMLGSSEETFLRVERSGCVDECLRTIKYLLEVVNFSETDYIAHHARYTAIADLASRTAAISTDASIRMTLETFRAEAEESLDNLESYLSPFPRVGWSKNRSGGVVEQISSASGWKGPSDHDDDPAPAA